MAQVPIQNLFYLLCYARNCLEVRGLVDVSGISGQAPMHLYAAALDACVARLRRKGLPRRYRAFEEVTSAPRGRISLSPSISRGLLPRRRLCCEVDTLSADIPFNRLVKAALRRVAGHPLVAKEMRARLLGHARFLGRIRDIAPGPHDFAAARGERLDATQRFMLSICELVLEDLLIEPLEASGTRRHQDPARALARFERWDGTPRNMGLLFESFVFHFLAREQRAFRVRRPGIQWQVEASQSDRGLLPAMKGDVLLSGPDQRVLIECKCTGSTLQYNRGSARVKSPHLYQLHTYMTHLADDGPPLRGLLLYAQAERPLALDYVLRGHPISVRTLNLAQPWPRIHDELLACIFHHIGVGATQAAGWMAQSVMGSRARR